jgi:hypothetical protein
MTSTTRHLRLATLLLGLAPAFGGCGSETAIDSGSTLSSLTGKNFTGKKYYFGWGSAGEGDPMSMQNETKYDVLHTHEIFTNQLGGSYTGTKLVDSISNEQINSSFGQIKSAVTANDMFVQYSAGHGFEQGLQYGGNYDEIASRVLSLPAKEIIVFTMACHSGGLVDAFNSMQSQWSGFAAQGRTLYVMSSSTVQQTSSTGPGVDSQVAGPEGSAGSAFGHALWKALAGQADGAYDGIKDGYIELGEIETYVKRRTREIGGHDPVTTGTYNAGLIMNRVPTSTDGLSYADRGTTNASDGQLWNMIQQQDQRGNEFVVQ